MDLHVIGHVIYAYLAKVDMLHIDYSDVQRQNNYWWLGLRRV